MRTLSSLVLSSMCALHFVGCETSLPVQDEGTENGSSDTTIALSALMHTSALTHDLKEGSVRITNVRSLEFAITPSDSLELYYYDSLLKQVMEIKNGRRNGVHVEFHENGRLYFTGHVLNDVSDGVWREYDESGNLMEISCVANANLIARYDGSRLDSLLRETGN